LVILFSTNLIILHTPLLFGDFSARRLVSHSAI